MPTWPLVRSSLCTSGPAPTPEKPSFQKASPFSDSPAISWSRNASTGFFFSSLASSYRCVDMYVSLHSDRVIKVFGCIVDRVGKTRRMRDSAAPAWLVTNFAGGRVSNGCMQRLQWSQVRQAAAEC